MKEAQEVLQQHGEVTAVRCLPRRAALEDGEQRLQLAVGPGVAGGRATAAGVLQQALDAVQKGGVKIL
ncbi:hypothetical protein [Streptomyces uncialis]|uniref:hypothetical protein n=1 Tax=Streptomyces uncialis TaxID=1048205 RepID=UPI00386CD085|nr:hypothetical protein OG268_00020 [Streptomyces uncialis]WST72501.1 hypothetical protein OG268_36750 [Streptomyces uncialis]